LQLGCNEALQDEEIAKKMNVCQKTGNRSGGLKRRIEKKGRCC
jgi:hypothetical protein